MKKEEDKELFDKLKKDLLHLDPVYFCENYLTLDGKPFTLHGNGYKPFVDIYRYVGIKALEPTSKPIIIVKGRQVGGTLMANSLEMYFMGSGLFGNGINPPIRVMHTFPQLELAAAYSKTKLTAMMNSSKIIEDPNTPKGKGAKVKTYMQSLLDTSAATNDSLHFKQFQGGNHLWIESVGIDGDRLIGRSCDVLMVDECFPYKQKIATNQGKKSIGKLYNNFIKGKENPLILSFNEKTEQFEYKKILNAWNRGKKKLIRLFIGGNKIDCTPNHKFLTEFGWQEAKDIELGTLIKTYKDSNHGTELLNKKEDLDQEKEVYDIEIEDNHNFILSPNSIINYISGPIAHNCQKTSPRAMGNVLKILTSAKYGKPSKGVQVYFGTPRQKGTEYHRMWQSSSQQYYHLGCENCHDYFPLYTPESDEWEKIWIHGFIVKCPKCGHEQEKLAAQERGKWVASKDGNDEDCKMVGFHINQLYMPMFSREDIENEKPSKHLINTERIYQNEVLGEFFQGDSSPMSPDQIRELCADFERKFSRQISIPKNSLDQICVLGIDYGARADLEQLANIEKVKNQGQSYSTAVVLLSKGPGLLSIEFATKFKRNDVESKKGIIDQLMREYSIQLAIGDIGYSNDFSEILHNIYGDRYLVSRAHNKINDHVKFNMDAFPKELIFERDFYIAELFEQMKKGMIRFPYGDYEKIAWLVDHCSSMELKPSISKYGEHSIHYVKGGSPNDGFMALLNAYLAYKFLITGGFTNNGNSSNKTSQKALITGGYISRRL